MNLNGIWKIEMLGPYGWEPMSTAFFEDGRYISGSRNHYAVGSYQVSDKDFEALLKYVVHGEARSMFGKKENNMDLKLNAEIRKNKLEGQISEARGKYPVTFRARRLENLPTA